MIYSQTIETPSYLCDVDDRLHTWAAVRLCQEVTEYHGNATGIGFQTLLAQRRAWVISHALYNVYRLPSAFERITLETWARGDNGLIAFRDYCVRAEASGEVLLTGTSHWPLISLDTRRVVRLGDVVKGYSIETRQATAYSQLAKLQLPDMQGLQPAMSREVCYAMLDHTQHVNNSEYIRMLFDHLITRGFDLGTPFSLEVNYAHESRLGDGLQLYHVGQSPVHFFRIDNPRGTSVSARVAPVEGAGM